MFIDRAKIAALFGDEYKLPPLENPLTEYIIYGALIGAICGGGIGGIICFLIKKKKKNQ